MDSGKSGSTTASFSAAGSPTSAGDGPKHNLPKRAMSSPEQFFKDLFAKKDSKKGPRRSSLLGPWIKSSKESSGGSSKSRTPLGSDADSIAEMEEEDDVVGDLPKSAASRAGKMSSSSSSSAAAKRSSRVMSSRYWGGRYRVCTDPSVLRNQLSTDAEGDYVKNEVIARIPISAWIIVIAFCDIPGKANVKLGCRALREVADHTILQQLSELTTLDEERDLLSVISHPQKSCAEDLWLLRFFQPAQLDRQKAALVTVAFLEDLKSCVCIEDVILVLKTIQGSPEVNFSMGKLHEVLSEVKRNFDALERDEWRISVQPVLAQVVRDCRFKTGAVPMTLQLSESIENSQAKRTLFKKKAEVKCNGSVWDTHDSEFMFTYFEGGTGELWHWPVEGKKAKLVSSMKLANQRPAGAAFGQTKQRCIAYGAQFQSTITVMRAHNSDWTRVPKTLDATSSSSLLEVFSLTGHEGYVSSVQFFAQDKFLVSGSGDSSVKVWDLERQYVLRDITSAHSADVLCVSTAKLANHIFLTAGAEGTVFFHDHRVDEPLFSVGNFTSDVGAIRFHQNGLKVIAGSFDGSCSVFDSRKPGPAICEYSVPGTVLGCDFYCSMGDSEEAVIIAEESSIQVVYDRPDVDSYVLDLHSDRITSVNASLDSRLAVSSWDGATSVWTS